MRVPRTHWARSLSGVQNNHAFDTRIASRRHRRGSERIVRLKLHHGPDDDAGCRQGLLERSELRQQVAVDAGAGLIARPQIIAERLDDVIGRNGNMGGAVADHAQDRCEYASDSRPRDRLDRVPAAARNNTGTTRMCRRSDEPAGAASAQTTGPAASQSTGSPAVRHNQRDIDLPGPIWPGGIAPPLKLKDTGCALWASRIFSRSRPRVGSDPRSKR